MRGIFRVAASTRFSLDAKEPGEAKFKGAGPIQLTIVCGVLLSLIVASATGLFLADLRNRDMVANERTLSNTAVIIAKQIEHIFATVENVQKDIIVDATASGSFNSKNGEGKLSNYDLHLKLRDKAAGMPYVGSLTVINAEGRMVNFSRQWPIPDIDVSDRDFFKAFQSDSNLTTFIGTPVRNRVTGTWVMHLARKISGSTGEFLGLTSAAIELQYIQNNFSDIAFEHGSGVSLFGDDGMLFARNPRTESEIGRRFPAAVGLKLVSTANQGVGVSAGGIDGQLRMVAAHRIGSYPLLVATTKTVALVLADWKRTATYAIFAAALIIIAIAAFAILFVKMFRNYQALIKVRAQQASAKQLLDQSLQFKVTLDNMPQGVMMFDASSRIVVCNDRYLQMYGLSAESVKPGLTLPELIKHREETGSFQGDPNEYCHKILNQIAKKQISSHMIETTDGRTIHVLNRPIADGGWVATHEDITEQRKLERERDLNQKFLDLIIENVPSTIVVKNVRDFSYALINRAGEDYYGISRDEIIGKTAHAFLPKETADYLSELDKKALSASRQPVVDEHMLNMPGGKRHIASSKRLCIRDQNGEPQYLLAVIDDITAQREAKDRLHEQKRQLDAAIANMSQGLIMFDASERIVMFNQRYIDMCGLSSDAVASGRMFSDLLQARQAQGTFSGDVEAYRLALINKLTMGESVSAITTDSIGRSYRVINVPMAGGGWVATHEDVTEKLRAEQVNEQQKRQLESTQAFLDTIVENVPLPIIVKSVPGAVENTSEYRFTLINLAAEQFFGIAREQMIGKCPHDIYSKDRADFIVGRDNEALQAKAPIHVSEHAIERSKNDTRIVTTRKVAIRDDQQRPQYLLTLLEDVTEKNSANMRIAYLAHYDSLTALPNRATFVERFSETLDEASKSGEQFAVLCLDLDRFKEANDTYGHLVGDELLRQTARRLQTAAAGAFLARIGGDEFALIMKGGPQPASAEALGERVLAAFKGDFEVDGCRLQLGLSIGGAIYPTDGTDAKTLMANADAALYQAKAETRGSVRFFEAELGARLRDRRNLQKDIQLAISRNEFFLQYQPQEKMASKETVGFEALARWQSPKRGLVAPGSFIPVAEESKLIIPLGEWILREACREAASWPEPLTIAVNISPIQFHHGDLPALVHSILLETGLAPARLELEITEGVLIDDFSRAVAMLRRLKSLGVQIAMDDFGSGYSSLSYLHSFPFDKIKIDRSFIGDLEHNHHSMAIVRAIITLGHSLGVPVLAEGVETESQHQFLVQEGCDEVQGYLTGRPHLICDYAQRVGRQTIAHNDYVAVAG